MATFEYKALNASGQRVDGTLAGPTEQAVMIELESRQLTPVAIAERAEARRIVSRISKRKLGESYEQLADLLHAGVPLLRSIRVLANRKSQPKLSAVFRDLGDAVEKGQDLAAAMSERPDVFPPVHVAMVRAGEKGGFLEQALKRLGLLVVGQAELKSKVAGSLVYPSMLLAVGVLVLGVIFAFFVPMMRTQFEGMPGGVPAITRLVLGISDAVTTYGLVTAGAVVAAIIGARFLVRRPGVSEQATRVVLRAPLLGRVLRSYATAQTCQLLGSMLTQGVPMLQSLQVAREGAPNVLLRHAIENATEAVKRGENLAPPLAASGFFDDDVVEMIAVGEAANDLDSVLLRIAATIETRLDRLLNTAIKLIEPMLLISLAGVVALVAFALILPMLKLSSGLSV